MDGDEQGGAYSWAIWSRFRIGLQELIEVEVVAVRGRRRNRRREEATRRKKRGSSRGGEGEQAKEESLESILFASIPFSLQQPI